MNNQAVEICCIVKAYITLKAYTVHMYADKVGYMEKKKLLHLLNGIVQHEHSAKHIILFSTEESKSYRFGTT